jgi:hypothetical protein
MVLDSTRLCKVSPTPLDAAAWLPLRAFNLACVTCFKVAHLLRMLVIPEHWGMVPSLHTWSAQLGWAQPTRLVSVKLHTTFCPDCMQTAAPALASDYNQSSNLNVLQMTLSLRQTACKHLLLFHTALLPKA